MPDPVGYHLSLQQWRDIQALMRDVATLKASLRPQPRRVKPRDSNVQAVRITSTTATDGRYPGNWYEFDAATGTWTQKDAVWVVAPNGVAPTAARVYEGAAQRGHEDGRAVFTLPDGAGASAVSIISSDGTITIDDSTPGVWDLSATCCDEVTAWYCMQSPPVSEATPLEACCEEAEDKQCRITVDGSFCGATAKTVTVDAIWNAAGPYGAGWHIDHTDEDGWSVAGWLHCQNFTAGDPWLPDGGYAYVFTGAIVCAIPVVFGSPWSNNSRLMYQSCDPFKAKISLYVLSPAAMLLEFTGDGSAIEEGGEDGGSGSLQCLELSASQLAARLADGWTQVSGPYDTSAECLEACTGGSGSGSGGASGITRTNLGTASSNGALVASLALPDVVVEADSLVLLVAVATGSGLKTGQANWGVNAMTAGGGTTLDTVDGVSSFLAAWYYYSAGGGTGEASVTLAAGTGAIAFFLVQVNGLTDNDVDQAASAEASTGTPTVSLPTTTVAAEYIQAAFALVRDGAAPVEGSHGGGFSDGGQDVTFTVSGTTVQIRLVDSYRTVEETGDYDPSLSGSTSDAWGAIAETYS